MGSCQMLAEPHLPTPKCCYWGLQAECMTGSIIPQWCFTDEKPDQTDSPSPSLIPPSLPHICICISFYCLFTRSPTSVLKQREGKWTWRADVHLMVFVAPWIHSLPLKCFSFPGFDCSGCMRTKICTWLLFSPDVRKTSYTGIPRMWWEDIWKYISDYL